MGIVTNYVLSRALLQSTWKIAVIEWGTENK